MKKIKAFLKNHKVFCAVTLLGLVSASFSFKYYETKDDKYFSGLGQIQILNDTTPNFVIGPNDYIEHNKIILSVLQDREMTLSSELSAKNSVIWQMRNIYFAVIAGLFTLLLSKKSKTNTGPYIIIILLIIITYLFDVHLEDLYNRKIAEYSVTKGSVDSLQSSMSTEKIWYDLNYINFYKRLTEGFSKSQERLCRKFLAACEI